MNTFTYSQDIDAMIAQTRAVEGDAQEAKRRQILAWLLTVASWKRANAKRFATAKEFAKESGISQSQVSKAVAVLDYYDVLGKAKGSWKVSDDDVVNTISAFMENHKGDKGYKVPSGIYIDLFGADDTWTLAAACETLVKAARKRDISDDEVLAIIRQTLEAGE